MKRNQLMRLPALFVLIATLLSLFACAPPTKAKSKILSFVYFDTESTLYDYSGSKDSDFAALVEDVKQSLQNYHKLYDIYNEYEGMVNLATINKNAGNGAVSTDKKIIDMLLFSKEMYALTDGEVNVAMGAVLKIWHSYREMGDRIPPKQELEAAALHTDINNLVIDEENLTVELLDPQMSLDVGAIAKGYAVEMIARKMEEKGLTGLVIDVGGNLRAIGTKKDGTGWKTGVKNPTGGEYVYYHELKNEAIVTSGSYERFYTVDGVKYHHIINGETLMPENHYLSVTVISNNSAFSDALSTAVFNMKYDEAKTFAKTLLGTKIVVVLPNGKTEELN